MDWGSQQSLDSRLEWCKQLRDSVYALNLPPQQTRPELQSTTRQSRPTLDNETPMVEDHTPTGYSPYCRKRRNSTPSEDSHTQVAKHMTQDMSLPHWHTTPPQPAAPPTDLSQQQQSHALSPLLPTPSQTHVQSPATQVIPSLMDIKFTPHTRRQLESRRLHLHTPRHNTQQHTPYTPLHIPRNHSIPHAPYTSPTTIPLVQTIAQLLNTAHQLLNVLNYQTISTHMVYP